MYLKALRFSWGLGIRELSLPTILETYCLLKFPAESFQNVRCINFLMYIQYTAAIHGKGARSSLNLMGFRNADRCHYATWVLSSSYTFESVQTNADAVWKIQRYDLVKEYYERPPFTPPFILIAHIFLISRKIGTSCGCCTWSENNPFSKWWGFSIFESCSWTLLKIVLCLHASCTFERVQ